MALVACPECGHQVSTLAKACPQCGAPPPGARTSEPVITGGLLGKLATVLGAWLVMPWVVRLLTFIAAMVMFSVMFAFSR
ncbi:zinc ribbon domain-containing protein [Xenophilus azovorans]|uniref:zinc ribbon domain-containing protein n=1 Tax=Xenophilus TaxID=151754 RepID=UPI000570942C|nr:zinc ribbon domain-containing protein [Xenophilus azovorans]